MVGLGRMVVHGLFLKWRMVNGGKALKIDYGKR